MDREIELTQVTDGKKYMENDMVKVGCNDCSGCSQCCETTGDTIVLDPYDVYRLCKGLSTDFATLLSQGKLELNVEGGIIKPNLKPRQDTGACPFLGEDKRCTIHPYRTGYCRIYPLGRLYEDGTYSYILQVKECPKPGKTKMKVSKWIDTERQRENREFITTWHYYVKNLQLKYGDMHDEARIKEINMLLLQVFFMSPYDMSRDFYEQFYERLEVVKVTLGE